VNGPEHYEAAEVYLRYAKNQTDSKERDTDLAFAQVHAALALTAATAQAGDLTGNPVRVVSGADGPTTERYGWDRVIRP
jgi:hypothetical protein